MTRRERKERRLERRLEWAESRESKAAAVAKQAEKYRHDYAFNTQPGHIPERARLIARQERAFEDSKMAEHHRSKAAGIAEQLERSIFSDDHDAAGRLRERIAELEGIRDARKRANAAYKRGGFSAVLEVVGKKMMNEGVRTMDLCHWEKVPFPPYSISNIGANIRRLKGRLAEADQLAADRARVAETLAAEVIPCQRCGRLHTMSPGDLLCEGCDEFNEARLTALEGKP